LAHYEGHWVGLATQREGISRRALDAETKHRVELADRIGRLEQRLLSLQNAQSLKCPVCRPNWQRRQELESRLNRLLAERRAHLHELFDMKQEALEAAISERDSQLALLEVSGIKTAKTAEHADRLKADKKRLMELMKEQNEKRVKMLQEFEQEPSPNSEAAEQMYDSDDEDEGDEEDGHICNG